MCNIVSIPLETGGGSKTLFMGSTIMVSPSRVLGSLLQDVFFDGIVDRFLLLCIHITSLQIVYVEEC